MIRACRGAGSQPCASAARVAVRIVPICSAREGGLDVIEMNIHNYRWGSKDFFLFLVDFPPSGLRAASSPCPLPLGVEGG